MYGNKRWQPAAALAGGLVAFMALTGCRTFEGAAPQGGDPPSPGEMAPVTAVAAPQAVAPGQPAKTLSPDPLDAPAPTSVLEARRAAEMAGDHGGHGNHGTGTYRQVDAGRAASEGSEPHQHQHEPALPPPSGHEGHSHEPPGAAEATAYACPMHPEVTSNAPGKCSKCGMELVERRKE